MKRVLLIEDQPDFLENMADAFDDQGIEVIKCSTREAALAAIGGDLPFDAVVLDWYFYLVGDSALSKQILKVLKGTHFRPVFIYTGQIEDYENTPDEEIGFPKNLLSAYSKNEFSVEALRAEVQTKVAGNYSLQIASTYRKKVSQHLENVCFELNELQNVDLAMVLTRTFGAAEGIDWSNDLILNLLHRSLIGDNDFIESVAAIVKSASANAAGINLEDRKRITNRIVYFHSPSDYIRNGDIVQLQRPDGKTFAFGVVVTPDCDLEQRKTKYVELVELRNIGDASLALTNDQKKSIKQFNHDSFYYFPAIKVSDALVDFVAVLKSKVVVQEVEEPQGQKYPSASKRLLFSHEFYHNAGKVKLRPVCSITNPYKAEFLQKLHTNNTRVGIPDIKDLWLD